MTATTSGALARAGLAIRGPTAIAVGDNRLSLGRVGVLLLAALDPGRVPVPDVKTALWGEPGVPTARLRQAAMRVNRTLAAAGCPWRVRLDTGDVVLLEEPPADEPLPAGSD